MEDAEITNLVLHEYKKASNMTDQFAALAAIAQKPGETRDEILADFYTKWQHDFLVSFLPVCKGLRFLGILLQLLIT